MGISFDTVEWLGAGIGAKASVPAGFRLADARWRTGLARCGSIELHPFLHRIARANRETELTPSLPEVL